MLQKVEKSYAFEVPDIPTQCEYLEVRYSVSMSQRGRQLTTSVHDNRRTENTFVSDPRCFKNKIKLVYKKEIR